MTCRQLCRPEGGVNWAAIRTCHEPAGAGGRGGALNAQYLAAAKGQGRGLLYPAGRDLRGLQQFAVSAYQPCRRRRMVLQASDADRRFT